MAFTEVVDLDAETTTALGGRNKKTGKPNPTEAEGYFLGTKKVESKKARSGFAELHILKTPDGNLGIWGKTDLDRKIKNVVAGTMVRITQNGTVSTPNGDMYKFRVEQDKNNTIEVELQASSESYSSEASETFTDSNTEDDDDKYTSVSNTKTTSSVVSAPDAARQAKVQALLNGSRNRVS